MASSPSEPSPPARPLSKRESLVLRALVSVYLGDGRPVGSQAIARILPVRLSPASVRNTLAELAELGIVSQPHRSAGRLPTERGLRLYVDELLRPPHLPAAERRRIEGTLLGAGPEFGPLASRILSEQTRQLGFVVPPRLDRVALRHVALLRLSSERVLAVLVSHSGTPFRRVLLEPGSGDQGELDRIAALLNQRIAGRSLREAREQLLREARVRRARADRLLARALSLGLRAAEGAGEGEDLVIATRLALLDQPEFRDTDQIRQLFAAIETDERLVQILDRVLEEKGVTVAFGAEVGEPGLRRCALVAARYGDSTAPLGALGVIGPTRMDYARVIPLVECLSDLVTESLSR